MHWIVTCTDAPDGTARRAEHRAGHFAHLKAHSDRIVLAGALQNDDRSAPVGSLLVVDFPTKAEVEAFCEKDPFVTGGVFNSVVIKPYKRVEI